MSTKETCRTSKVISLLGLFLILFLCLFLAASTSFASTVQLQWDPNIEEDLAGYRVYYKANSAEAPFDGAGAIEGVAPIDVANQTTAIISGLDPGTDYYFAVTAYNSAGLESAYSNVISVAGVNDTTDPSISILSPIAGTTVSGVVAVTATATDDVGVSKVEYYENGVLITAANVSPYSYNWNTGSLPGSMHTLEARAYDAAGNVGQSSNVAVTVLNDKTAPSLAINQISTPTNHTSQSISGTVGDDVSVAGVTVRIGSGAPFAASVLGNTWSCTLTGLASGVNRITVRATDLSGNGSLADASITVQPIVAAQSFTIADAMTALQIAVGRALSTGALVFQLDVAPYLDGRSYPDGKINTGDVIVILSKLVGE